MKIQTISIKISHFEKKYNNFMNIWLSKKFEIKLKLMKPSLDKVFDYQY
jgi:hypothetical protein